MDEKCEFCEKKSNGEYYLTTAFHRWVNLCIACRKKYAFQAFKPHVKSTPPRNPSLSGQCSHVKRGNILIAGIPTLG